MVVTEQLLPVEVAMAYGQKQQATIFFSVADAVAYGSQLLLTDSWCQLLLTVSAAVDCVSCCWLWQLLLTVSAAVD